MVIGYQLSLLLNSVHPYKKTMFLFYFKDNNMANYTPRKLLLEGENSHSKFAKLKRLQQPCINDNWPLFYREQDSVG